MSIPVDLQEWQQTSFQTHKQLIGVELPEDEITQTLIRALSVSDKLNVSQLRKGLSLEASSYVGRIALGDLQITIRPKIKMLPLLRLLQYTYELRRLDLFSTVGFDTRPLSFQDLLINQFAAEVSELLLRGLHRRYVRREGMLSSPRGKIAIQTIANQGAIVQAALPCIYYPRLEDCLINQVLLQGVYLGIRLTNDDILRIHLLHLAHFHLSDIASIRLDQHTLKRLYREMDRLTSAYVPTITLIKMLLAGEGISIDESQPKLPLQGFLFDMNIFFQDLLSRFLREHLQEYDLKSQFEIEDMMVYIDNPRNRQPPRPRPDFVIKKGGKIVAILDAKYRDLWEKPLPPEMLYQLVMYALSQETCNSATILYPTTQSDAREAKIKIQIPAYVKGCAYVILRPVNLLKLEKLITESRKMNNERERTVFAQQLVFGDR